MTGGAQYLGNSPARGSGLPQVVPEWNTRNTSFFDSGPDDFWPCGIKCFSRATLGFLWSIIYLLIKGIHPFSFVPDRYPTNLVP